MTAGEPSAHTIHSDEAGNSIYLEEHTGCCDHACDDECDCRRIDFMLDKAAIAEYAEWLFGASLPLTVERRQQKWREDTQMFSVARDCNGWMRYKFDAETETLANIKILLVSAEPNPDDPFDNGSILYRTAGQTLRTLAHEFQHIRQLLDFGPVELHKQYKTDRDVFEDDAKEAEKHWLSMGHLLKPRKRSEVSWTHAY
jgi:hypothetical protein